MRPKGERRAGLDEALDRLTSVVGMATVFYDAPSDDRLALVVNADRRRLMRLLDDTSLNAETDIAVIGVLSNDDLPAVIGRARLTLDLTQAEEVRPRVLIAAAPGQEKVVEAIRAALHRMDFSPLFWDAAFNFDDARSNPPVAAIIDTQLRQETAASLLREATAQDPPIPVLAISSAEDARAASGLLTAGAMDFLVWPFGSGEIQAALARTAVEGLEQLRTERIDAQESETAVEEPAEALAGGQESAQEDTGDGMAEVASDADEPDATTDHDQTAAAPAAEAELVKIIGQRLAAGEAVSLEGIGVLDVRHETSRIVHDDQGRTIVEPPRRTLQFSSTRPSSDDSDEGPPVD
jgi:FixJ family two-component response regulator